MITKDYLMIKNYIKLKKKIDDLYLNGNFFVKLKRKNINSKNYWENIIDPDGRERKRITELVEQEALEIANSQYGNAKKFLVLTKQEWHPGIIGIVAARMVDKFNLPTAILSKANDGNFRGSIRSNTKLKVNLALDECNDLLLAHGGHSAAAGFSIDEKNIQTLTKAKMNDTTKYVSLGDLSKVLGAKF